MAKEERIGNPNKNLVFRTSGNIRVLVGDKYYTLKYDADTSNDKNSNSNVESNFIISENSIDDYINGKIEYPGDGKIIFVPGDSIYYTTGNSYYSFNENVSQKLDGIQNNINSNIFNNTVTFNGDPAFVINKSQNVINNLNAQFLEGYPASSFIKKTDSITFSSISTSDGTFKVENGDLMTNTITTNNINTDILVFNKLIGSISIGTTVTVNNWFEYIDSLYLPYNIKLLEKLYDLYKSNQINTDLSFIDLAQSLLEIVNSTYNWEKVSEEYIEQIIYSDIICKPINVDTWKTIKLLNSETTLYDIILTNIYLKDIPTQYNKAYFNLQVEDGNVHVGDKFTFQVSKFRYYDSNNEEILDKCNLPITYNMIEESFTVDALVTAIDNSIICIATNLPTWSWENKYLKTHTINVFDNDNNIILTYNVENYNVDEDNLKCAVDYNISEIYTISNEYGKIGDLNEIDCPYFNISGYGLYLKENGTLINPNLIWVKDTQYIKLSSEESFIGINDNNNPWITVTDKSNKIETSGYTIDSNGFIKTKSFIINPDGTITIGDVTGTLTRESDGTLKII